MFYILQSYRSKSCSLTRQQKKERKSKPPPPQWSGIPVNSGKQKGRKKTATVKRQKEPIGRLNVFLRLVGDFFASSPTLAPAPAKAGPTMFREPYDSHPLAGGETGQAQRKMTAAGFTPRRSNCCFRQRFLPHALKRTKAYSKVHNLAGNGFSHPNSRSKTVKKQDILCEKS